MSEKVSPPRNQLASTAIALSVIAIGLGSRKYPARFPALLWKYYLPRLYGPMASMPQEKMAAVKLVGRRALAKANALPAGCHFFCGINTDLRGPSLINSSTQSQIPAP